MEMNKLAKHSLIYSGTSILAQSISLFMVPIYTKNMVIEQYGQYNLLISVQSLLAIFITLGIFSGMTRFFNEFEDKNKTKNIVLTFSIVWGLLMCLFSVFFGEFLYHFVFPSEQGGGYYINFIVISSVLLCQISIYNSYFTMQFKSKHVSVINLSRVVFMLIYSAYFIILRKEGLHGALQAQMFAFATVLVGLVMYDLKNLRFVFAWKELKLMLKYGTGLVPGQTASWIFTLIDRYFIKAMLGLQQVAIYSMGYRIGMMMEPILLSPFKSVFTSFKYKVYKEANAPEKIREIYVYYNFFGWFCILGFSVFAKPAIDLLSTPEYAEAFIFVPLIVFSYFLNGLGEFYSLGIHIKNKSIVDSYILGAGAGFNILLNIVLIPILGIMGAAFATVVSYFIMNILFFLIGKRYLDLGLKYFEPFKGGIIFLVLYGIYLVSFKFIYSVYVDIIYAVFLCLLYIILSIMIGFIPREVAKSAFLKLLRKISLIKTRKVD